MSCISHANLCPSSGDLEITLLQKILQSLNEGGGGGGAGVSSISVNGGPAETGAVSLTIPAGGGTVTSVNGDAGPAVVLDTDDITEGATNLYFTEARVRGTDLAGFVAAPGTVTAADTVLSALEKLQGSISPALVNFTDETADADAVVWADAGTTEMIRAVGVSNDLQMGPGALLILRGSDGRLTLTGRAAFNDQGTGIGHSFAVVDANTASAVLTANLTHTLTTAIGTAANGIGIHLDWNIDSSTTAATRAARWSTVWTAVTHASRNAVTTFNAYVAGTETPQMVLGNNQIAGNPGTLAAPSFANRNEVTTGLWFPAAGTIGYSTAGLDTYRLTNSTANWWTAQPISGGFSLRMDKSRGTTAVPVVITSGDTLGNLQFRGYDGASFLNGAAIQAVSVGTVASTRIAARITLSTATDVAPSVLTARLTCDAAGAVGLGPSTTPSGNLDVNNLTTTTVSYFYATTDGNASPTNYSRLALLPGNASDTAVLRTEAGGTGLTAGLPRILKVGSGPSSGTDIVAQSVVLRSGQSTGTGVRGDILFQQSAPGSTGSAVNGYTTSWTISTAGALVATGGFVITAAEITLSKRISGAPVALTDAATIATDASLGNHFRVTLGGNRTLGNPTNPVDGQRCIWEFLQDGTGTRTITFDTQFDFGTDLTGFTLSTAAGTRDFIMAVYNGATTQWDVLAGSHGL